MRDNSGLVVSASGADGAILVVGRDSRADIPLAHPAISWKHAQFTIEVGSVLLEDLGSTNGTSVEGQALVSGSKVRISSGMRVRFGSWEFTVEIGAAASSTDSVTIAALGVTVDVPGLSDPILRDVDLCLLPGELVAIVGPSGSGKTTLLRALSGLRNPTDGMIMYNDQSLYDRPEAFRGAIGFVPQDDIIPSELRVRRVLEYACQIRLPDGAHRDDIIERVDWSIDALGLHRREGSRVRTLSGGERKRVNVAVELLTQPMVLFLDEPTAGLDPGSEGQMMQVLRSLATSHRTVVLSTHSVDNLMACDVIVLLATGGHVVFVGTPLDALNTFEVSDFRLIYSKLGDDSSVIPAVRKFRASSSYESFIRGRLARPRWHDGEPVQVERIRRTTRSSLHQWKTLTQRYFEIIMADWRSLSTLLLQAPLISLMIAFLFENGIFQSGQSVDALGYAPILEAPTFLLLISLSAIWCGVCNSAREICKERAIFQRESHIGVSTACYLLSKISVLFVFCLLQSFVFWLLPSITNPLEIDALREFYYVGWIFASSVTATMLGLALSSNVSTSDQASMALPIILIPQVLLAGVLIGLEKMGALSILSAFVPSRWAVTGLGEVVNIETKFQEVGAHDRIPEVFLSSIGMASAGLLMIGAGLTAVCMLGLRRALRCQR